jgi:predicted metalloenzyme YecM
LEIQEEELKIQDIAVLTGNPRGGAERVKNPLL